MYKTSKKFLFFFLWLVASSMPAVIYFTVVSLIFPDGGKSMAWMLPVIFINAAVSVFFYSLAKLAGALKPLLSLLSTGAICFGSKYLMQYFFSPKNFPILNDIVFAGVAFGIFLFTVWMTGAVFNKFKRYYFLLDSEKDHKQFESYFAWLKTEATGDPKKLEVGGTVTVLLNFAIFMLLLLFVAVVKTPASAGTFSVLTVLYAAGSLGIYMVFHQFSSLIKWKLMGYRTDNTIVKNWNNLLLLFLVPVIVIPLVIPWNYSIVKSQALTDFFNQQFSKISVNIAQGALQFNQAGQFNEGTRQWQPGDDEISAKNRESFWNVIRIVAIVIGSFIVLYTLAAIIGWIMLNKYKYARKNKLVQFFINRYYKLKSFFEVLGGIFSPIFNLFARKKPEEEGEKEQLEKHLYTYFESIKELPVDKQEEIRTIIREFVRFIQTASRLITPYYFFLGPMEYTEKVIDLRPTLAIDLRKVANIFNESRYSLHILGEDLKSEYQKIIDILIISIEKEKDRQKA